jgi:hypothetical protein
MILVCHYLDESEGQETGNKQSHYIEGETRNLGSRTRQPVIGEQVSLACAIHGQPYKVVVKCFRIVDLEGTPRRRG